MLDSVGLRQSNEKDDKTQRIMTAAQALLLPLLCDSDESDSVSGSGVKIRVSKSKLCVSAGLGPSVFLNYLPSIGILAIGVRDGRLSQAEGWRCLLTRHTAQSGGRGLSRGWNSRNLWG